MLFHLQSAVVGLIVSGAVVMSLAIVKTKQITAWLKCENENLRTSDHQKPEQGLQNWRILSALMSFFLLGYCLTAYLVIYRQSDWLTVLTGVVFFVGALFVLFSVSVYATTLHQLIESQVKLREESDRTIQALEKLRQVQHSQMLTIHTEKMHSLGQMSAGIAHEINNPVNFIYGNLTHIQQYATDLFSLISAYEQQSVQPANATPATLAKEIAEEIDLDFIRTDIFKTLHSMKMGSDRIKKIVSTMRNFSRLDESQYKLADVTEGINSTLMMLQGKLNDSPLKIEVATHYDPQLLPLYCDPRAINQALLQILGNAIESFDSKSNLIPKQPPIIEISTRQIDDHWTEIIISDNGKGISDKNISYIFDPFFTTKPIGKGTGLGLSISHQIIVEQHKGRLSCCSQPCKGTAFILKLPVR